MKGIDSSRPLTLLGAGGHGRVAADLAEDLGFEDIVFLDDAWPAKQVSGAWPIVGRLDDMDKHVAGGRLVFVSVGDNQIRLSIHRRLLQIQRSSPALIHPSASVSRHASLAPGCLIAAGAIVAAFAQLGDAVIVNTSASVDHDCVLAEGVHVASGANLSGGVQVGEASWIGAGACVREGAIIGSRVMVGAGAAVVSDIADMMVVLGVPARQRN